MNHKNINAFKEALLVDDTNCSLIISKSENKKKVYYSVVSSSEYCETKKGSEIEMSIRKGSIQKGREGLNPCPTDTLNPPMVIEGKQLDPYVDANDFGVSNPSYLY